MRASRSGSTGWSVLLAITTKECMGDDPTPVVRPLPHRPMQRGGSCQIERKYARLPVGHAYVRMHGRYSFGSGECCTVPFADRQRLCYDVPRSVVTTSLQVGKIPGGTFATDASIYGFRAAASTCRRRQDQDGRTSAGSYANVRNQQGLSRRAGAPERRALCP